MKKIIFLFSIFILLNSCSDILIVGCTDPYAINYEPNADNDDLSCLYEADVVFYGDVSAAVYFDNLGIDWLDVYVGNNYVGTLAATTGFTYVPDCFPTDPDAVHFTLAWETQESTLQFMWTVRDGNGTIHASGNDVIMGRECLPMELTYLQIQEYKEETK